MLEGFGLRRILGIAGLGLGVMVWGALLGRLQILFHTRIRAAGARNPVADPILDEDKGWKGAGILLQTLWGAGSRPHTGSAREVDWWTCRVFIH